MGFFSSLTFPIVSRCTLKCVDQVKLCYKTVVSDVFVSLNENSHKSQEACFPTSGSYPRFALHDATHIIFTLPSLHLGLEGMQVRRPFMLNLIRFDLGEFQFTVSLICAP